MTSLLWKTARSRSLSYLGLTGLLGMLAGAVLCLPLAGADKGDRDKAPGDPDKVPGDDPAAALTYNLLAQQNEKGFVPRQALFDAVKQLNAIRQQAGLQAKVAGLPVGVQVESKSLTPLVGGLTPGGWKWLGPGNIGGRTLVLLIDPKNPDILYAGTASGGIWKTRNGGKRWDVLSDFLGGMAISTLVMDPAHPEVLYAGTGERYDTWPGFPGEGIFQTRDGGSTWKQLPGSQTADFDYVNRLALSADGKVLLAATSAGVFRRERDAEAWVRVKEGVTQDVRFHPRGSDQVIAGGYQGQAFYSSDGGKTWSAATGLPALQGKRRGRVELTYAVADPNLVYASVDNNKGEVYRSPDGGKTYQLHNGQLGYLSGQGFYDNTVWADDPTSADHVIIGGLDLWRSSNGGKDFTRISDWRRAPKSAHADQHWIVAHPRYDGKDNKTVYFGNDGGVYRTDDVTTVQPVEGWQALNNNFGATQFYGGAGNPRTGTIIGGTQDNGTLCFTREGGELKWTKVFGGDGGYCAADLKDADYFYCEVYYLNIFRSEDGGRTSLHIAGSLPDADLEKPAANFIAPFLLDPNDSKVLLGGGKALWRCANARVTEPVWKAIKPPRETLDPRQSFISAVAVAQGDSKIVWVGHNDGVLFQTSSGTADEPTWKQLDQADPPRLPRRKCTRITLDSCDSQRVFATFGGYDEKNLWRSEDGGGTWTVLPIKAEGAAPLKAPVHDVVIHPSNARYLYAGTEVGVFASEDDGKHWSPTNEGPTSCPVYQLFWMDKTLVAVTHGRGMYQIDLGSVPASR